MTSSSTVGARSSTSAPRRRLFTGSARGAALLQALLRAQGGLRCLWPGCDAYCGFHNRTKERGFRPDRRPDGTWIIHRPDDQGPITPAV